MSILEVRVLIKKLPMRLHAGDLMEVVMAEIQRVQEGEGHQI